MSLPGGGNVVAGGCPVPFTMRGMTGHLLIEWPCAGEPGHDGDHEIRTTDGEQHAWCVNEPGLTEACWQMTR